MHPGVFMLSIPPVATWGASHADRAIQPRWMGPGTLRVPIAAIAGTDPSSRALASGLRDVVIAHVWSDGSWWAGPAHGTRTPPFPARVELDFSGVLTVAHSFADELIAVLFEDWFKSMFRERVRIIGANADVRASIAEAVATRRRWLRGVGRGLTAAPVRSPGA
jgi:hypothetical protein